MTLNVERGKQGFQEVHRDAPAPATLTAYVPYDGPTELGIVDDCQRDLYRPGKQPEVCPFGGAVDATTVDGETWNWQCPDCEGDRSTVLSEQEVAEFIEADPYVLSREQAERLEAFERLGKGKLSVRSDKLEFLGIQKTDPIRLKSGSFEYVSGGAVTIAPGDWIITRQGKVETKVVRQYIEMMQAGRDIEPVSVTDVPPGGGHWHLNGLHRMAAARILGRDIKAEIFR